MPRKPLDLAEFKKTLAGAVKEIDDWQSGSALNFNQRMGALMDLSESLRKDAGEFRRSSIPNERFRGLAAEPWVPEDMKRTLEGVLSMTDAQVHLAGDFERAAVELEKMVTTLRDLRRRSAEGHRDLAAHLQEMASRMEESQ